MGKLNKGAVLQLAGIGGGAALNAYLGKKAAEKYGLSPEEKKKLMIRRGLKGAALGALGATAVNVAVDGRNAIKNALKGDLSAITLPSVPKEKTLLEKVAKNGTRAALLGGIAGRFYGQDVKDKVRYAKDSMKYNGFNPETGKFETKGQSRLFADGGGLAGFGAKALNWWNKRSDAQKGAIIGGVAGAGIGAARKGVKGALVGAGVGAGAGALGGMAYKKWGNGALKNTFGGDYTSTSTTRPTRTSTSPSTGSNHNRTTAVNFDPRTKTQSNLVKNVFKGGGALAGGMYGAGAGALLGAGIGAARGGFKGALKGAGIGAVAGGAGGAGLGYYGGSKASEHTTKAVKDMMEKVKKHSNYLPVVKKQANIVKPLLIGAASGAITGGAIGHRIDSKRPVNPNDGFLKRYKGTLIGAGTGALGGAALGSGFGYLKNKAEEQQFQIGTPKFEIKLTPKNPTVKKEVLQNMLDQFGSNQN